MTFEYKQLYYNAYGCHQTSIMLSSFDLFDDFLERIKANVNDLGFQLFDDLMTS